MQPPSHDKITRLAQLIWQDKGSPSGCDVEIWLEAERQLTTKSSGEIHSDEALAEQRKEALAPQRAAKTAPRPAPAETGKPLWRQPHSR